MMIKFDDGRTYKFKNNHKGKRIMQTVRNDSHKFLDWFRFVCTREDFLLAEPGETGTTLIVDGKEETITYELLEELFFKGIERGFEKKIIDELFLGTPGAGNDMKADLFDHYDDGIPEPDKRLDTIGFRINCWNRGNNDHRECTGVIGGGSVEGLMKRVLMKVHEFYRSEIPFEEFCDGILHAEVPKEDWLTRMKEVDEMGAKAARIAAETRNRPNPVLGLPRYEIGDEVVIEVAKNEVLFGRIEIVDAFGTAEVQTEPSYDVFVKEKETLYKHVKESRIISKGDDYINNVFMPKSEETFI